MKSVKKPPWHPVIIQTVHLCLKFWKICTLGMNFIQEIESTYTSQKAHIIVNGNLTKSCEIKKREGQDKDVLCLCWFLVWFLRC